MIWRICKYIVLCIVTILLICVAALGCMWYTSSDYTMYGIPVLNYHQVNDTKHSALTLSTDEFKEQMAYLHKEGYHTITLVQLYAYVTQGTQLPSKPVVITFDDGYVDNYHNVLPILKAYGMNATLFMISDAANTEGFLSTAQLHHMEHNDFFVEGHTNHHHMLTKIDASQWEDEIDGGKRTLSTLMGKDIQYLAYPGGFNNEQIQTITKQSGYKMAFTVSPGTVQPGQNLYALPRLAIFQGDAPYVSFLLRLHCAPFIEATWGLRDWLVAHGYMRLSTIVPLF